MTFDEYSDAVAQDAVDFIEKYDPLPSYRFSNTVSEIALRKAILAGKVKSINHFLDYFDVPKGNLDLKERIAYFQLNLAGPL